MVRFPGLHTFPGDFSGKVVVRSRVVTAQKGDVSERRKTCNAYHGIDGDGLASHRNFFVRDDLADALGPQEIVEVPSVDLLVGVYVMCVCVCVCVSVCVCVYMCVCVCVLLACYKHYPSHPLSTLAWLRDHNETLSRVVLAWHGMVWDCKA